MQLCLKASLKSDNDYYKKINFISPLGNVGLKVKNHSVNEVKIVQMIFHGVEVLRGFGL